MAGEVVSLLKGVKDEEREILLSFTNVKHLVKSKLQPKGIVR